LADLLLQACAREQGTWLFVLDQTGKSTAGQRAGNTYCPRNTKKRAPHSRRQQQKTPPRRSHLFVCGLLIAPQSGTRIPAWQPYYTRDYCRAQQARATAQRPAPRFRTQADIAADLIRAVRAPAGQPVLVLGDTAFEARQIRAACAARGFHWITPANPERVLAGPKPRPRLSRVSQDFTAATLTRIELCPGLTDWWRHQRGSRSKAWRGKYARRYWARTETLDVHHIGTVRAVFSTTIQPQPGQAVQVQKILLTDQVHWDAERIVGAYASRWQIELFFKEMKSDLGLDHYRLGDFAEVEGWVQACAVAFCYLEWYRWSQHRASPCPEWWFRQRTRGLALQVRQDIEEADLDRIAECLETARGRQWLRDCLRQAVPAEQRRPAC
jgi:hypothetical protein